jgi:SAM-dependent methyltransferase
MVSNKSKYIYDRYEDSEEYKQELIELIRSYTNLEIGGHRVWGGQRTHLMQNPWELTDFIFSLKRYEISNNIKFENFLEVGFASGFNNTVLNKFFKFENIVGIDIFTSNISGSNLVSNITWKNLTLICADSTAKRTISLTDKLGPYDLIFIDANHTYEYVKKDFENYIKLLTPGGVLAFHDIDCPDWPGINKFWNELKSTGKYEMQEFVCRDYPLQYGIGMLSIK